MDGNKLWKILKEIRIPDNLTFLLRNVYAGQEATIRTRHITTEWFKIGKEVQQDCILSLCLFNFCAEYIMGNARLDEFQAGIKIAGRNINNLRYADDTTMMAENKEKLKSFFLDEGGRGKKKEGEKAGLKLNIQKMKIMASGPITSWQIDGEKVERVAHFIFLGSKITMDGDCSHEIKKTLGPWKKSYDRPRQHIKKSRDITLSAKVHIFKAVVFLVVMYGYESWTTKKAECRRIDAFELWCWRRFLRVPWTARRSN